MSIQYTADQLQRKFRGPPGSPGFSRLADVLRKDGKLDEAIQLCQEGLKARPNTLSGYMVLGKTLMDAGRVEEARDQFEAALRQDPRCLSAMHYLARIMTQLQWAEAAAGYYRSILEVEPWDAEIRALLGIAAPQSGYAAQESAADSTAAPVSPYESAAPALPAQPPEEDTFHKPEGFAGDVMEVNLNDVAADFLPSQDMASLGLAEESLEDALSASQAPVPERTGYEPAAPPERIAEPKPQDEFKEAPTGSMASMDADAPPISGQDVEDRLDALFGVEESPVASLRAATATWSPVPPEDPAPEIPPAPDFTVEPEASATGELRAAGTGEMPIRSGSDYAGVGAETPYAPSDEPSPLDLASVPDLPKPVEAEEIPGVQDFSAVDFETPLERRSPAAADAYAAADETGERIHGEDIERRLDELFNLTEEDNRPPTETSSLPVAPGPNVGEAVSLGEVVPFGGEIVFEEPLLTPEAIAPAAAPIESDEDLVTGQDVADKLDNLFGAEPEAKSAAPEAMEPAADPFLEPKPEAAAFTGAKPWTTDEDEMEDAQPPLDAGIMSTVSMLPPGWFGEAGDGPRITGADVEAQLDKLFHIEEDGETGLPSGAAYASGSDQGNTDNTVAFLSQEERAAAQAAQPMPGDEADLTVMMPVMHDTASPAASPRDASKIKESVADWLARQTEESEKKAQAESAALASSMTDAGETLILPAGAGFLPAEDGFLPAEDALALKDFDANLELPASARETSLGMFPDDGDSFGTLAPEDLAAMSDTTSIEMVDGVDVAERLDELFADEVTAAFPGDAQAKGSAAGLTPAAEMSLFIQENGEALDVPTADSGLGEGVVSGEDVSSRLNEMFDVGELSRAGRPSQPETGVPAGTETDEDVLAAPGFAQPPQQPAPELAPMMDEEDGYPEEEEMSPQTGAGANVATVTLAEIYFQQGLREQALQIYRQLLEREPENDSVRKRIEEIEATKPEGGDRGPGSDPRRPRPGLKVPKRKK
jgi:tetratricopeptide (TPR) repeat protein